MPQGGSGAGRLRSHPGRSLLGGVAVVTLLAAASMSIQKRLRELSVLHAVGCTTAQLTGASAVSQAPLERSAPPLASPWA